MTSDQLVLKTTNAGTIPANVLTMWAWCTVVSMWISFLAIDFDVSLYTSITLIARSIPDARSVRGKLGCNKGRTGYWS